MAFRHIFPAYQDFTQKEQAERIQRDTAMPSGCVI